jgi:hypothetical protein
MASLSPLSPEGELRFYELIWANSRSAPITALLALREEDDHTPQLLD